MSNFEVKVQKIFVKAHPNADALELGNIGSPDGWQVVVKKNQFRTGDLVAYIGENAVVPEWVLKKYGFWNAERDVGVLAGKNGDRVKGVKLRGEFSLGICIPVPEQFGGYFAIQLQDESAIVSEGQDVAGLLGVTKYEPPIPTCLAGEIYNAGTSIGVDYDLENIRNWPDAIAPGEEVIVTEKIHGTQIQIVVLPDMMTTDPSEHLHVKLDDGTSAFVAVSSKGQAAKGLFLKHNERNENNTYMRALRQNLNGIVSALAPIYAPITLLGEVFGDGIQDLKYGMTGGKISLRVFDVYVGYRGQGQYVNSEALDDLCFHMGVPRVPVLYKGPFDRAEIAKVIDGKTTVVGGDCIREGGVIGTAIERSIPGLGRVKVKWVSEDYLTRKNGTEHN